MPKICNLVVFWDDEAGQILPVLSVREPDFRANAESAAADGSDGVLLADCRGAEDLQQCDIGLSVAEAKTGRQGGSIRIVASVDSAAGLMQLSALGGRSARLSGLTWNRGAFCSNVGCSPESPVAGQARAAVVIAARAFGVPVYDSHGMDEDAGAFGFDGVCIVE